MHAYCRPDALGVYRSERVDDPRAPLTLLHKHTDGDSVGDIVGTVPGGDLVETERELPRRARRALPHRTY